ncbi:MAG: hypothetical protein ACK46Q_01945 [Hyphomonas sp.]
MKRFMTAGVLAGLSMLAAPPALAFGCGPDHILKVVDNFQRMQQPGISGDQLNGLATEIRLDARRCEDTGWIRIIAAGAEIQTLNRDDELFPAEDDEMKAVRFARLGRAIDHVIAFRDNKPEDFQHGGIRLRYDEWSGIVEPVVHTMLRYADAGQVHPLASDTPPPMPCDYVTTAMATNASNFRFTRSPAALRLLTSIADVCRPSEDKLRWGVLAQRANTLVQQVKQEVITEPHRIRWALREAYQDTRQYLDGREAPVGVWFESRERDLKELLEQYPDSLTPETPKVGEISVRVREFSDKTEIPRADWFRPEQIGKDATVYSIALDLSGAWTDLAAGITDADTETVGKDRVRFMNHFRAIEAEADAAGQGKAGREMLVEALAAFQTGVVRTRATAQLPPPPGWMYGIMHNVTQAKIDAAE